VLNSVLDAIKQGVWDYEPGSVGADDFGSTDAIPGSDHKLDVLAERISQGLPLWHPADRRYYDDLDTN